MVFSLAVVVMATESYKDTVVCKIGQIMSPLQPGILISITRENTGAPPSHLPPLVQITKSQYLLATVIVLAATSTLIPIKGHIIKDHQLGVGIHALA